MFRILKNIIFLSLFLALTLEAKEKELTNKQMLEFESLELFKKAGIKVEKAYDIGSLYLLSIVVQGNKDEIFLTKDKNYLISGAVINTTTGMQIKAPVNLAILKDKEAFTYGNGKDEYILFTDPECSYCKKFESFLPQIKDKVKIKVFFFPLDFHENAKDLSIYIMSKKTRDEKINAMFEFNIGDNLSKVKNAKYSKNELEKLEKKLEEHINLGISLNVQGTPALFDKDGNSIVWVNLLEKYGIDFK